jgi:hypothetical protein
MQEQSCPSRGFKVFYKEKVGVRSTTFQHGSVLSRVRIPKKSWQKFFVLRFTSLPTFPTSVCLLLHYTYVCGTDSLDFLYICLSFFILSFYYVHYVFLSFFLFFHMSFFLSVLYICLSFFLFFHMSSFLSILYLFPTALANVSSEEALKVWNNELKWRLARVFKTFFPFQNCRNVFGRKMF